MACRICGSESLSVGTRAGSISGRTYEIRQCPKCWFAFVADPWLDYELIYNEDYYLGRGADPLVDYAGELEHWDTTVRQYEWRGTLDWASSHTTVTQATKWLDYGCGAGGLVRYLRSKGYSSAEGFEQGWSVPRLRELGIPVLSEAELTERRSGWYDVVTMVEVIEHVVDPIAELRRVRQLLRPGGILLLTTGNAKPYRRSIAKWRYLLPDIHVSLFEPETLGVALVQAGFDVTPSGYGPGWKDIIRFKMLKNIDRQSVHPMEHLVPWSPLTRLADLRWGFSAFPIGQAPAA